MLIVIKKALIGSWFMWYDVRRFFIASRLNQSN